MVIKELCKQSTRVSATIEWESTPKKSLEVYIRAGKKDRENISLRCVSRPFLIAALLPAMRAGEKRIRIEGEPVDPFLVEQLRSVMALANAWWGGNGRYKPLSIEADVAEYPNTSENRVAASFLTGGIDSLATLRNNRVNIPQSHPQSIEKNIFVYGMDGGLGGRASEDEKTSRQKFQEAADALVPITLSADTELIPVYTNIRSLDNDNDFYTRKWYGSILAAVSHFLAGKLHTVYVGSAFDFPNLRRRISHPLMQSMFTGSGIQIMQEGTRLSRLEKVRLLASWPEAIDNMRVCFVNRPGELNCGQCEKCIRTKLELAAVGKLNASEAFSAPKISQDLLTEKLQITSPFAAVCYEEVVGPLKERGYSRVADTLETKLRNYRARRRRVEERDWRGVIKRGLRYLNLYQ